MLHKNLETNSSRKEEKKFLSVRSKQLLNHSIWDTEQMFFPQMNKWRSYNLLLKMCYCFGRSVRFYPMSSCRTNALQKGWKLIPWTKHFRFKMHASTDHVEDVNLAHTKISVAKNCCDFKAFSTLDRPLYKVFVCSAQYRSVQRV